MNTKNDASLREHVRKLLDWQDSHMNFYAAVKDVPPDLRGKVPAGLPYSVWQLIEHLRLSQRDILEFCVNPDYEEKKWPDDYWPQAAAPPDDAAWKRSIEGFRNDLEALKNLASDSSVDIFAQIPHGTGQTYLRELLLNADHNAYHTGQIIAVRRCLGNWK